MYTYAYTHAYIYMYIYMRTYAKNKITMKKKKKKKLPSRTAEDAFPSCFYREVNNLFLLVKNIYLMSSTYIEQYSIEIIKIGQNW